MLGLKFTTFLAGISIGANVVGFIPLRAAFFFTENVPKPIRIICLFCFISSVMISITAFKTFIDSVLLNPVLLAIALVNSFLFIKLKFY